MRIFKIYIIMFISLTITQPSYCQIGKTISTAAKAITKKGTKQVGKEAVIEGTEKAAKEMAKEAARYTIKKDVSKSLSAGASKKLLSQEVKLVDEKGMTKVLRSNLEKKATKGTGAIALKGVKGASVKGKKEITEYAIKKEFGQFESKKTLEIAGKKGLKNGSEKAAGKKAAVRASRTYFGDDALKLLDNNTLLKKQVSEMEAKFGPSFKIDNLRIEQAGKNKIIDFPGTNSKIEIKGKTITAKGGSTPTNGAMNEFLNNPLPNTTYNVDNFTKYVTDGQGKTIIEECHSSELAKNVSRTNLARQNQTKLIESKGGKQGVHDSGHIQAHATGGNNESINILPMKKSLQRGGRWANTEKIERDAIDSGADVWSRKEIKYNPDGSYTIKVKLTITDPITGKTEVIKRTFKNLF